MPRTGTGRGGSGQCRTMSHDVKRQLPIGAEIQPAGGVHFRVWAPAAPQVEVEFQASDAQPRPIVRLHSEPGGYHAGLAPEARPGMLYRFRLPTGSFPDPASRYQPDGPHGWSQIVSPATFTWTDDAWRGPTPRGQVVYELHLGTFTREGTWRAAQAELPELKALGITMIEVMPIADFPGTFGWGYDGVNLFAPSRLYGSPDDARAFVNRAHELGLSVILDVVYNHFGPDGNYLRQFSPAYFSSRYKNEWGEALNFDGPDAAGSREFFVSNACYWIQEYHFDGLRFDATQQIYDDSPRHILTEISTAARRAAGSRQVHLVAENECQSAALARPPVNGGQGLDAIWNDDWHHSAMVAATGRTEAYYTDYRGTPQEFISATKHGFLYQGQWYHWQEQRRGHSAFDLHPHQFVVFLQNHDQVANALRGLRLHQLASPGITRALTALTLLVPQTPLLFQGQEFAASAPFLYFADHHPELNAAIREGRGKFLQQFRSIAVPESIAVLPDPTDRQTFLRCKLDLTERVTHRAIYQLHADLLRLRREDRVFAEPAGIDGAVLGTNAFVLRYFSGKRPDSSTPASSAGDRLLVVNLGADLRFGPAPEPLLASPTRGGWQVVWSSESPVYGGHGTPSLETTAGWLLPGQAAFVLKPDENREPIRPRLSEKD
ncbi:MAG TPA: malto-oligosyltrehalose trehalohydrolase [Lacunisphaera sp.]|nr:malto-oligosyltrehalose trehalohydrolase [Lacunisphaera sp.]